jgi:hypothetical protein
LNLLYCSIHVNVSAQAAVLARLQDEATCQHRDGLLKALQLCERFINSNAASDEAYAVLKQEVAKAMLQSQQPVRQTPSNDRNVCLCFAGWLHMCVYFAGSARPSVDAAL